MRGFCNSLNNSLSRINLTVDEEGKLVFTDSTGADSVIPFSSVKVGTVKTANYEWTEVNLGFKPKYVILGAIALSWLVYDETVSTTQFMVGVDGALKNLGTTSNNPCSFVLTDTGFKIYRNYATAVDYHYVAY